MCVTNLCPLCPSGDGPFAATVVQHSAGATGVGGGPKAEAELQERQQRGGAAAALYQVQHGSALQQHGPPDGHQGHEREEGESILSMPLFRIRSVLSRCPVLVFKI